MSRTGRAVQAAVPRRVKRRHALARRKAAIRRLARIARGSGPIVAGPWIAGAGLELLYWIPFLRWLTTEGGVDSTRIVAISRLGADPWYSGLANEYIDVLDLGDGARVRDLDELDSDLRRKNPAEKTIVTPVAKRVQGRGKVEWLRPQLIHRLFAPRWRWGRPASIIASHTEHEILPEMGPMRALGLPADYAAVRVAFNPAFPFTDENRASLRSLVAALAERTPVVILRATDESSREAFDGDGILSLPAPEPRHSLALQTDVIRGASAFVSTYGGMSYLGPYVGTPTLAVYSRAVFEKAHLDTIDRVGRRLGEEGARLYRARHIGSVEAARPVDLTAISQ